MKFTIEIPVKIAIEIPDEQLSAALFHDHPTPKPQSTEETQWFIDDPIVRCLLWNNGFSCRHVWRYWYVTNCPIAFNGSYPLRDGYILESHGTTLTWRRER